MAITTQIMPMGGGTIYATRFEANATKTFGKSGKTYFVAAINHSGTSSGTPSVRVNGTTLLSGYDKTNPSLNESWTVVQGPVTIEYSSTFGKYSASVVATEVTPI